jgi:hemoglobin
VLGSPDQDEGQSFYDKVGGHATFVRLIGAFFEGVRADPELLAMYSHDLAGAEERLRLFMEQYWGGPMTYSRTRGAPRLRMRHMPYKVTPRMRDHWLACMHHAVTVVGLPADEEFWMRDYIERAADFLVNAEN